jgi:hypothetical protein
MPRATPAPRASRQHQASSAWLGAWPQGLTGASPAEPSTRRSPVLAQQRQPSGIRGRRPYRRILAHCRRSALVTRCDPIPGRQPHETPNIRAVRGRRRCFGWSAVSSGSVPGRRADVPDHVGTGWGNARARVVPQAKVCHGFVCCWAVRVSCCGFRWARWGSMSCSGLRTARCGIRDAPASSAAGTIRQRRPAPLRGAVLPVEYACAVRAAGGGSWAVRLAVLACSRRDGRRRTVCS